MEKIYAKTESMAVLRNRQIPVIGTVSEFGKRFLPDGTQQLITLVELDYENNGCTDSFYFENGILVYFNFAQMRGKYMANVYKVFAKQNNVKQQFFLDAVVMAYVIKTLGFD
ncbi:MAG: hypothetical protein KA163_05030 [Bacteroidia bacterium]|nr:hypothetical protein [Bacteroidia bacterium]